MTQLRTHLENYIQALESLLSQHSDSLTLLDAAEDEWGTEDIRYLILQQRTLEPIRFDEPNSDANPEEPIDNEFPNELINWLPAGIDDLRSLLAQAADDKALLTAAEDKWKSQRCYGYLVIKAGGD